MKKTIFLFVLLVALGYQTSASAWPAAPVYYSNNNSYYRGNIVSVQYAAPRIYYAGQPYYYPQPVVYVQPRYYRNYHYRPYHYRPHHYRNRHHGRYYHHRRRRHRSRCW